MKAESKNKIYAFEGIGFLFKVCWRYDRWYILLLVLQEIITSASALITVMIPGKIINSIFVFGDLAKGLRYLALLMGITLVTGVLQSLFAAWSTVARTIVYKRFQLELSRRLMAVRFERTETAEFLDLKAKAEQFISSGGQGFGGILEQAFGIGGTAVTIVGYAWILSKVDILLTLLVLALTGLSIWLNYHLSRKSIEINLEKASQERRSAYYAVLTQDFKFGKEIRSNDCSGWISSRYEGQLNILQKFYEKLSRYGVKYGCLILLVGLVQRAATYLYLIDTVVKGGILVGDFSVYLSAMESLSGGLKGLVGGIAELYQYNKYYEAFKEYYRMSEVDALPEDRAVPMPEIDRELTIAFHDVSFHYPNAQQYALSHVSCEIRKGDIISIVGDNGAGKSTFIKLLLRLYEPTEGTITINGVDISTISRSEYASHFACVFQDFQLLSFSLRDNITLGDGEGERDGAQPRAEGSAAAHQLNFADHDHLDQWRAAAADRRVDEALAFVNLTDRVARLEKGKDTMIYREFDKEGFTPSGGEAQRLAVARAVYRDSDVLILDEPTASLDPNIEYELNQQIRSKLYGKKTIINVSHRLHSVRYSNQIFVFRGGELVESGTHESLFASPTLYRQMFSRQASDYMDIPAHGDDGDN